MSAARAYLAATRRERTAFLARKFYSGIFEGMSNRLEPFGQAPEFDVTFSYERACETIRISGRTIVIYDQYLGQTFNQLNRFHANSDTPFDALAYGYKLASEFAEVDGQTGLAALLRLAYALNKEHATSYLVDIDVARRGRIGAMQEAYVLAHESFHSILDQQPKWRSQMLTDARRDFLHDYHEGILSAVRDNDPDAIPEIEEGFRDQMRMFEADDALVEECICDTLALGLVFPHPDTNPELYQLEDARSAAFFALRHLRSLGVVKQAVRDRRGDASDDDRWLLPYVLRTQFQHWTLLRLPTLAGLWSDAKANERFEAEQQRYSYLVEAPLIGALPEIVENLSTIEINGRLAVEQLNDFDLDDIQTTDAAVAARMAALGEDFFIRSPHNFTDAEYRGLRTELDRVMEGLETRKHSPASETQRDPSP